MTMTGGPTGLIAAGPLQAFTIRQNRGVFEAFGKGEGWVTTFPTVKRWSADVTALLPDNAALVDLGMNTMADPSAIMFKFNSADDLEGSGYVEDLTHEDPLDGPVLSRFTVRGNGALVATIT